MRTVTSKRRAEWWVLLNCWHWPTDLPGKPSAAFGHDEREQIMGAHAMLDALGVDRRLVDAIWSDETRRAAVLEANA